MCVCVCVSVCTQRCHRACAHFVYDSRLRVWKRISQLVIVLKLFRERETGRYDFGGEKKGERGVGQIYSKSHSVSLFQVSFLNSFQRRRPYSSTPKALFHFIHTLLQFFNLLNIFQFQIVIMFAKNDTLDPTGLYWSHPKSCHVEERFQTSKNPRTQIFFLFSS